MLSKALLEVNFLIIQAPGDADVAIVTRAVEYGRRTQTVLARNGWQRAGMLVGNFQNDP